MSQLKTLKGVKVVRKVKSNVYTENELAELFGVMCYYDGASSKSDSLYELNEEFAVQRAEADWAYYKGYEYSYDQQIAYKECEACEGLGYINDDDQFECTKCDGEGKIGIDYEVIHDDPDYEKYLNEVETELYEAWRNAFEAMLEKYLSQHSLAFERVLIQRDHEGTKWYEEGYRLKPAEGKTWVNVAQDIVETINGVGYFEFRDAKELKESVPCPTYREAAMDHAHWMKRWGDVYGDRSPKRVFGDALQVEMRNW